MWEQLLPLAGGLFGASSASSAAAQQAAAARQAEEGINKRFEINRQDQMPFMQTGYGANSMLAHLMGIKAPKAQYPGLTGDALRQKLLPQFTTPGGGEWVLSNSGTGEGDLKEWRTGTPQIDEAGLQAAMMQPMGGGEEYDQSTFGSLLRDFNESDIYGDPIFKMAQKEAADAVNERAMRGGMYNSGATLKELMKANSGVGTDAFNRWNTQQGTKYNRLAGLMGSGQQAVNQVGNMGAQAAQQAGEYATQGANARAAGVVGGANAWGNALSSWNQGQQRDQDREFMKSIWGK